MLYFKRSLDWEFKSGKETGLFLQYSGLEIVVSLSVDKAYCSDLRIFADTRVPHVAGTLTLTSPFWGSVGTTEQAE